MDWFLYYSGLRHERVKSSSATVSTASDIWILVHIYYRNLKRPYIFVFKPNTNAAQSKEFSIKYLNKIDQETADWLTFTKEIIKAKLTFTRSNSTIETLEKGVKHVQS